MPLHLVTGYAGRGHVSATDQGSYNIALYGMQNFVQDRGNKFAAQMLTNNKIRIMDGDIMMQGRQIRQKENSYEDLEFENGTQGMKRNDLVVIHYNRSPQTGIESTEFRIIKGEAVEGTPADPTYTVGDITDLGNAQESEMPLYRVKFDNLNMVGIEPLFVIMPNLIEQINQKVSSDAIVQNAATRDPQKIASAAVVADLQDQINEQNTKIENISQQITVLGSATSTFSLESVPNSRRILVFTNKSIFSIIKWSSSLAIGPMLNEEDAVITAGTYPNIVIKNNLTSGNYIKIIY